MTTHNANNERIKRRYFAYLKEAKRHSEPTVDAVAKALDRLEVDTKHRDFRAFHFEQAVAFKKHLAEQKSQQSWEKLSKASLHATLAHLKRFFQWLAGQPGYKSRLQYSDADYFNLSDKDTRIATARREQTAPTLEQVKHVINTMPADTDMERRNRALIAFTVLTGARDSAIASMKLKHVDLHAGNVHQDAREVRTKYSKTFTTFFISSRGRDSPDRGGVGGVSPGGTTIRSSRRRALRWGQLASLRRSGWNGLTGAVPREFAQSFATPSAAPACRISTRIALKTRSSGSVRLSARPPKILRRGARTSDMKVF